MVELGAQTRGITARLRLRPQSTVTLLHVELKGLNLQPKDSQTDSRTENRLVGAGAGGQLGVQDLQVLTTVGKTD